MSEQGAVKEYLTAQKEENRQVKKKVQYHNPDVIIPAGYRVKSNLCIHFGIWTTQRLREHIGRHRRLSGSGDQSGPGA